MARRPDPEGDSPRRRPRPASGRGRRAASPRRRRPSRRTEDERRARGRPPRRARPGTPRPRRRTSRTTSPPANAIRKAARSASREVRQERREERDPRDRFRRVPRRSSRADGRRRRPDPLDAAATRRSGCRYGASGTVRPQRGQSIWSITHARTLSDAAAVAHKAIDRRPYALRRPMTVSSADRPHRRWPASTVPAPGRTAPTRRRRPTARGARAAARPCRAGGDPDPRLAQPRDDLLPRRVHVHPAPRPVGAGHLRAAQRAPERDARDPLPGPARDGRDGLVLAVPRR